MKLEQFIKLDQINNHLICFPTDTVYGVGCLINDIDSLNKIYELKERDLNKPLAVLVGSIDDALSLFEDLPVQVLELMKTHWPGALTIIYKKSNIIPSFLNPSFKTIGIRMPNSKIALTILKKYGPMAVTSINKSGSKALNDYQEIVNLFGDKIDYII